LWGKADVGSGAVGEDRRHLGFRTDGIESFEQHCHFVRVGPLLEAPYRVGKPLRDTLSGFRSARVGTQWRVLYRIDESKHVVIVQDIQHRSTAYRQR
jgi:mRNA-degrading endonuclease YafQ of YafQ-DinJ toxin-antitoxin module